MISFLHLLVAAVAFWTCYIFWQLHSRKKLNLPPGPTPLPIIGNLHQLRGIPHRTITQWSKKYGPLISLRFGGIYTVVVSSAEVAREVLTKHDVAMSSSRTVPTSISAHDHDKLSFAFLPVGPDWRKIRKLCKEHLFSNAKMDESEGLRREKIQMLREYIGQCCKEGRPVNVSDAVFVTVMKLMMATLFSRDGMSYDSGLAEDFKTLVQGIFYVVGTPNVVDFFPVLKWTDPQGIKKLANDYFGRTLAYINTWMEERRRLKETSPDLPKNNDFLETLLDMSQSKEFKYDNNDIAHILFEFLTGGSDTTAIVSEWTMTELFLNPGVLAKAKKELKTVIGDRHCEESDLPNLPYLQAIIKESFRFHTPSPLLVPRKTVEDVEINGYTIPKGTQILMNAWGIARDPTRWTNPEVFDPERFMNSKMDVKGQDFDLIPYGGGRRICPGIPLANRMLQISIATLIHDFDWKFVPNNIPGQPENAEQRGIAMRKAVPLRAIPIEIVKN